MLRPLPTLPALSGATATVLALGQTMAFAPAAACALLGTTLHEALAQLGARPGSLLAVLAGGLIGAAGARALRRRDPEAAALPALCLLLLAALLSLGLTLLLIPAATVRPLLLQLPAVLPTPLALGSWAFVLAAAAALDRRP